MPAINAQIPMKHPEKELVPRILVIAMFALMLGTVGLVAFAQLTGVPNTGVAVASDIVAERQVWLVGTRNGTTALADETGAVIVTVGPDTKTGFIAVIGIAVNRGRAVAGVTTNDPIRVVRRADATIAVIDDATGSVLELRGYGPDNVAAFANLLD